MPVIKSGRLRRLLRILILILILPTLVAAGVLLVDEKKQLAISFAIAVSACFLFLTGFEQRRSGSRRAVITAVMTAMCVVGRFIPIFKPMSALIVIAAMYLGAEAGFTVGALCAFVSDFYFGQGPWTPFQMLGFGLVGLFAGYLSPLLKKSRTALFVYGAAAGVFYSFVMDIWTVLWYNGSLELSLYLAALVTAIPHTAVYTVSNVAFLALAARPFGRRLERISVKYGL